MNVINELLPQTISLSKWLQECVGDLDNGYDEDFQQFLKTTMVSLTNYSSSLNKTTPFPRKINSTQAELVDQAIGISVKRKQKNPTQSNLLALGFKLAQPGENNHFTVHANNIVHHTPNTLVSILKSKYWIQLHQLIGDACMLYLLVDHVICINVDKDNNTFIQVAGPPLKLLMPSTNKQADISLAHVMFYGPKSLKTFSSTHALNSAAASKIQATKLICTIFHLKSNGKRVRLSPRLQLFIPWIKKMMTNFNHVKVEKTIALLCPLGRSCRNIMSYLSCIANDKPLDHIIQDNGYISQEDSDSSDESKGRKRTVKSWNEEASPRKKQKTSGLHFQEDIALLLQHSTPKKQIVESIRQIITQILPVEFWGPRKNFRRFVHLISCYIHGRQHDSHSIEQTVNRMSVHNIEWLNSKISVVVPTEITQRRQHLVHFIQWIWAQIIQPMLRTNFYITTVEGQFYHTTSLGSHCVHIEIQLAFSIHEPSRKLATFDLQNTLLRQVSDNYQNSTKDIMSTIRFVPKAKGVRPIMNLSKHGHYSTNQNLRNSFYVLKHEVQNRPRLLGASAMSSSAIYSKLLKYRDSWINYGQPQLYYVTLDIERCFDTMKAERLLQLLPSILTQEEYLIRHHSYVNPSRRFRSEHPVVTPGNYSRFDKLIATTNPRSNTVYIDGVLYDSITKEQVLNQLKAHLCANHVQIGEKLYIQSEGIPQGSVLSSLLCNLYYAAFEKVVLLSQIQYNRQHDVLLRYTDDFCFITSKQSQAQQFMNIMHRGASSFGCQVNPTKTRTNMFDPSLPMTWCGIVLNPMTMEIKANYSKLIRNPSSVSSPLLSCVTVRCGRKLSTWFVRRITSTSLDKCHALYFSSTMNSLETIRINAYELLMVLSMKAMYLLRILPIRNFKYATKQFEEAWKYIHKRILIQTSGTCPLTLEEVDSMDLLHRSDMLYRCIIWDQLLVTMQFIPTQMSEASNAREY
ncbi:hypothetical protein THRCLA_20460 [Thraustotheca clavata]|uniref:Telomerase reverse transcriptase n=1 Tax=Thraustotheca clavata TaxID=74557 RepID=A0A1W0A6X1_9STRA|nr:hypothetical protein THRCLA_20460 [Thraustotheca clavata]